MSVYRFALDSSTYGREVGLITSDTFDAALEALQTQVPAHQGDVLEIGVPGFPPARYTCVATDEKTPRWHAMGALAA